MSRPYGLGDSGQVRAQNLKADNANCKLPLGVKFVSSFTFVTFLFHWKLFTFKSHAKKFRHDLTTHLMVAHSQVLTFYDRVALVKLTRKGQALALEKIKLCKPKTQSSHRFLSIVNLILIHDPL